MKVYSLLAGVSLISLTLCTPARAQDAAEGEAQAGSIPDGGNTIVVTARKRDEALQDVPLPVSVVTGELADALGGIDSAREVTQLTPGVTFIEASAGAVAEPNIRGAGPARLPNSDAAIGLYRDGAYIVGGNLGGRTFQRFDTFDVERIEVLRGPQGALYGRNAVGGAINVITRKPEFDTTGEVRLLAGSQKTYGGDVIVNLPVSDVVAIRLGMDTEIQDGGFYRRSDTGAVYDKQWYMAGRFSARYRPSADLDITFTGDYADERGPVNGTILRGSADIFTLPRNTREERGAEQVNLGLNATWHLGAVTLDSVTNYRSRDSFFIFDDDATDVDVATGNYTDDASTFFQELRLSGGGDRLDWLVGADLFILSDVYDQISAGNPIVPAMMGNPAVNPNYRQTSDYNQTSYSAFGSVDFEPVENLHVSAEGRYSVDNKDLSVLAVRADGTPRYEDFPPNSPASNPSADFDNFSYGANLSYAFTPDLLAYARVGTAYRAGGFNAELGNPCGPGETPGVNCNVVDVPPSYDEENSVTYEVGVKTGWFDRQLQLNANTYWIEYDDILANLNNGIMAMADPLNSAMYLDNAGRATAWGAEIEMSLDPRLPEGWGKLHLGAGYSMQKGEYREVVPGVPIPVGSKIPRLRPDSYNANVLWQKPFGEFGLTLAGNWIREEGGFQDPDNGYFLDTVDVTNARVAVEYRGFELALQVKNLFDTRYELNEQGPDLLNGTGTYYRINDPRSYRASLSYRW